jgi:hypothetical protein
MSARSVSAGEAKDHVKYILRVPSASGLLHHLLAASTQSWQAEAFSIVETRYTKAGFSVRFATIHSRLNHLLDGTIHDVADDDDLLVLAKPENTPDSLLFKKGIPLWF